jgi:hypothetical protein
MGIILYIIVLVISLVTINYNREKIYLYIVLLFLLVPPSELIYKYITYKSDCIASSGLTITSSAKEVEGFVYEGLSERCFSCVSGFLTRHRYAYVDIADNNNIGDIADVYFRFELAKSGAKSCKDFGLLTKYMTEAEIQKRFGTEAGQCIARTEIEENDTKYQLLKAVRRTSNGDTRQFHKVRNRLTNERLAVSNSFLFNGGYLGWFWFAPGKPPYTACPTEGISLDGASGDNLTRVLVPRKP